MEFTLTTWAGDTMIGYEPIHAFDDSHAAAYAQGVLSQWTKGHEAFLLQSGVRYAIDRNDAKDVGNIQNKTTLVGTWHVVPAPVSLTFVWHIPAEVLRTDPEVASAKTAKR